MRRELAARVGIETRQVKFWFQNRRTQTKVCIMYLACYHGISVSNLYQLHVVVFIFNKSFIHKKEELFYNGWGFLLVPLGS